MKLGSIRAPKGAVKTKKRLGQGPGSGTGKTAGKGHKGQNARSGGGVKASFEGGHLPLQMRLPKVGFRHHRIEVQVVNLGDLTRKNLSGEVSPETLKEAGLIRSSQRPVKVLGDGEFTAAVTLKGVAVSASAAKKIEAAGGSVEGARIGGTKARRTRTQAKKDKQARAAAKSGAGNSAE